MYRQGSRFSTKFHYIFCSFPVDYTYTPDLSTRKGAENTISKGIYPLSTSFHMENMWKRIQWKPYFCGKVENHMYSLLFLHTVKQCKKAINKALL